eukprot:g9960.t1
MHEAPAGSEEVSAGNTCPPGAHGSVPPRATGANEAEGFPNSNPSAAKPPAAPVAPAPAGASEMLETEPPTSGAAVAPSATVGPPSEGTNPSSPAQPKSAAAAVASVSASSTVVSAVPAARTDVQCAKLDDGDRRGNTSPKTKGVPPNSAGAEASANPRVQEAPGMGGGSGGGNEGSSAGGSGGSGAGGLSTGAASLVSSFLKRGSTASADMPHPHAPSPPKTPTSLASLVAGVPPGSGGSSAAGFRTPTARTDNGTQTPRRGGDRFFHSAWPPSLKKRRRILYYPKPNDPVGRRILYWVRGNYRVKDNLGLSVAFWLSAQTQLPLQALTFVDPAIGRPVPSCNVPSSSDGTRTRLPGVRGAQHHAERQELPFGMAVEASALCEMEEALRALNVPLVAVACAESDIPSALACWCGGGAGSSSSAPGDARPPSADSTGAGEVAAAAMSATAEMLPAEGSVEITIMDECYHPRQLLLSEKVKDALRGTGALYAMDSSCVYPVNTNGGGAVGGQAGASAGGAAMVLTPQEFRRAQEGLLPAVLADLAPKPRLSLRSRPQDQMFTPGKKRATLPRQFEKRAQSTGSAFSVLSWSELRKLAASRFPGFGKPISRQAEGVTQIQDLISLLGGGERVGEAALRQTLDLTAAYTIDSQRTTDPSTGGLAHDCTGREPPPGICSMLEKEIAGAGFGGCLLHLLRLGSISSLSVVQALLCRPPDFKTGAIGKEQHPKMCESRRHLLEQVLKREYAVYRSHSYHRKMAGRVGGTSPAATTIGSVSPPAAKGQSWRGWMGIVPAWVWKELKKGQRDARQYQQRSPGEIRSAGSTVPSSVNDEIFSAIQVRLTTGARLHPSLASYWSRTVVKMILIPSQAVSLLVDMAEEFCLGAAYAGDVVPELLDSAFGVLKLPQTPVADGAGACVPSPGQALENEEGLLSALGGSDALTRFLSPVPVLLPPPAHS